MNRRGFISSVTAAMGSLCFWRREAGAAPSPTGDYGVTHIEYGGKRVEFDNDLSTVIAECDKCGWLSIAYVPSSSLNREQTGGFRVDGSVVNPCECGVGCHVLNNNRRLPTKSKRVGRLLVVPAKWYHNRIATDPKPILEAADADLLLIVPDPHDFRVHDLTDDEIERIGGVLGVCAKDWGLT